MDRPRRPYLAPAIVPPLLAQMPTEIQGLIYSHLDYQSLIRLSTTSRYFHQSVDPQALADPEDKLQFVMRAAKDFPQHRPKERGAEFHPGNYECYICFRVRSPELFDVDQAQCALVDARGFVVKYRYPPPSVCTNSTTTATTTTAVAGGGKVVTLRRFCIDCGLLTGLHEPAASITTKNGRDFWVCQCRRLWPKPNTLRCPVCRDACPLRPRKSGMDMCRFVKSSATA